MDSMGILIHCMDQAYRVILSMSCFTDPVVVAMVRNLMAGLNYKIKGGN